MKFYFYFYILIFIILWIILLLNNKEYFYTKYCSNYNNIKDCNKSFLSKCFWIYNHNECINYKDDRMKKEIN